MRETRTDSRDNSSRRFRAGRKKITRGARVTNSAKCKTQKGLFYFNTTFSGTSQRNIHHRGVGIILNREVQECNIEWAPLMKGSLEQDFIQGLPN